VSDPHPARHRDKEDRRTFLQKVAEFIHPGPDSRDELIETLADAEDNDIIGAESRVMLEGVIRMADLTAGDVMVAAPRMDLVDIGSPYDEILNVVIDTAHSRFPVYEGDRENIIGILLAKDLLKLQRAPELNIRALLRPAVFVPETKGLNDLLREFRGNRNHLAVVIDEFGRIAGLITIEDVLEQIVGEIEDEFDIAEEEGDIFALADHTWRVSGDTAVDKVNESFGVSLAPHVEGDGEHRFETIGGLIAHEMGHVPRRGERHSMAGLDFVVLHTKGGAVRWFKVAPVRPEDDTG
jgi:magnesium and cobalt transporter